MTRIKELIKSIKHGLGKHVVNLESESSSVFDENPEGLNYVKADAEVEAAYKPVVDAAIKAARDKKNRTKKRSRVKAAKEDLKIWHEKVGLIGKERELHQGAIRVLHKQGFAIPLSEEESDYFYSLSTDAERNAFLETLYSKDQSAMQRQVREGKVPDKYKS